MDDAQATFHVAFTLLSRLKNKSSQYTRLETIKSTIKKTASYEGLISLFE